MLDRLAPHAKAIWATIGTAVLTLVVAALPFSAGGDWWAITDGEWQIIWTAIPGAGAVTWIAPKNKPAKKPRKKSSRKPTRPVTSGH